MIEKIIAKIEEYNTIMIHRHECPDPDALGSQGGLAEMIKATWPNKQVFIVGEEDPGLQFICEMDEVEDEQYKGALVIVCDTADRKRISDERYELGDYLIKIDHHPNEEPYGDICWVDTTASSASEMVFELSTEGRGNRLTLNKRSANLLYAGIVGDTGRFRFPNTTERTHFITSKLMRYGIEQEQFFSQLYQKERQLLKLEGHILQHFELRESGLAVVNITEELLATYGVTASETSSLVHSIADVAGLKVWVFFVADDTGEEIRVRIRSKGLPVNEVAKKYRGGGHPLAAGAKASSWEETLNIIADLEKICVEQN